MPASSASCPMLTSKELDAIKRKALEQALLQAQMARACPDPLLPVHDAAPLAWTRDDLVFLKINKISPA